LDDWRRVRADLESSDAYAQASLAVVLRVVRERVEWPDLAAWLDAFTGESSHDFWTGLFSEVARLNPVVPSVFYVQQMDKVCGDASAGSWESARLLAPAVRKALEDQGVSAEHRDIAALKRRLRDKQLSKLLKQYPCGRA